MTTQRSTQARSWVLTLTLWFLLAVTAHVPAQTPPNTAEDAAEFQRLAQHVTQLYEQGRYHDAIDLAKKMLVLAERALGSDHPQVATNLNVLAALLRIIGRYDQALPLIQRALAISERVV